MHKPSGYSLVTCCSFDKSKNEIKYYRGKECVKMFCKGLKEQAMKIINYENKEMVPLTDKEKESYENQEISYICENEFCTDENNKNFKKYKKSEVIIITEENIEVLLIVFVIYAMRHQK